MLDVQNANVVAGGETNFPPPFVIEGLYPKPPVRIISTQATGAGATALRLGISGGRVRLVDHVNDFTDQEIAVLTTAAAAMTSGQAVWVAVVAFQHRPNANVNTIAIVGNAAAVADAAKVDVGAIESRLGENARFVLLGDVLFHRSADQVIDHRVDYSRRPAYVDEANKAQNVASQGAQASMGLRYIGSIQLAITLATLSAASAGDLVARFEAPATPFGGIVGKLEYVPIVNAAGAGAEADLRPNVINPGDSTPVEADGNDLEIRVATAVVGTTTSNDRDPLEYTTGPYFKPGATIAIELQDKSDTFSAGSGTLLVHLWECVPFGNQG